MLYVVGVGTVVCWCGVVDVAYVGGVGVLALLMPWEGDPVRAPICIQCALRNQHPARTVLASGAHPSNLHPLKGLGFRV